MAAPPPGPRTPSIDTTSTLLGLVRQGDAAAREALFARFLPILRRWAGNRLPVGARGLADTDDLVQITLVRALNRVTEFEGDREGAFLAYLRTILMNAVRDEIRRSVRRKEDALEGVPEPSAPSALETLIGREQLESYESGLAALSEEQREAIVLRLEFGFTHVQIAEALGKPSANAARMTVARSLMALARVMNGETA